MKHHFTLVERILSQCIIYLITRDAVAQPVERWPPVQKVENLILGRAKTKEGLTNVTLVTSYPGAWQW